MKKMSSLKHTQAGVTLVELMIGLTVGLVVTGGAMAILFGNQKMLLEKGRLDRTQEEFRFATTTITRLIRQANSFSVPASNNELVINFDSSQRDCLGVSGVSVTNKLKLENNQLLCIRNNDPDKSYVLAKNIGNLNFSYGIQKSGVVTYTPYFKSDASVDTVVEYVWNDITSVQTKISIVQDGLAKQPALEFIATSHQKSSTANLSSGGESQLTEEELKKLLEEEAKADKKAEEELKAIEEAEEKEVKDKNVTDNPTSVSNLTDVLSLLTIQLGSEHEKLLSEFSTNGNQNINLDTDIKIYLNENKRDLSSWKISWSIDDKIITSVILPEVATSKTTILSFKAPSPKNTKFHVEIAPTSSCNSCSIKKLNFMSKE
ncbi:PilW family protein [Acinetobacter indicus]|uniref:Prepilin-type N-terminal cleavage/methylation domain-containing protein n=1 Tax=Acinetobacter indicus CIP 110367 TaxID=1341679 RepID=V2U373_9GAMM|nr:prepilin-type N-terminal cleavage/methylation domain-containing protein [Acinetobacter indicus]EPF72817.1 hypothetical protein F956_01488 [Acinetobacter indicus ANC 4215]ESK48523.1 hypothetical protein P253_01168 [Acinetobacter indicus CIP 110367]